MRTKIFSAIFIILFMAVFSIMSIIYMPKAISNTENPTMQGVMVGTWAPVFEKSLNESFPIFTVIRNFWGNFEYDLFGEGRQGVVIGDDGWLFTAEEFECVRNGQKNMTQNLAFIAETQKKLQAENTEILVVLLPSKARLYNNYLGAFNVPACRASLYADTLSYLQSNNIRAVSLLDAYSNMKDKDSLFLKTDTHWTPEGARVASMEVFRMLNVEDFERKQFLTHTAADVSHDGDLLRYLPGVKNDVIHPDTLSKYETEAETTESDDAALSLFGDSVVPITLVGTSYSANTDWNFYGFLKDTLDIDILDMSDEGLGPFAVMDTYLASDAWKNTPPKLVIWEIPERYMTMDYQSSAQH